MELFCHKDARSAFICWSKFMRSRHRTQVPMLERPSRRQIRDYGASLLSTLKVNVKNCNKHPWLPRMVERLYPWLPRMILPVAPAYRRFCPLESVRGRVLAYSIAFNLNKSFTENRAALSPKKFSPAI